MDYSTFWGMLLIAIGGISFVYGLYATNGIFKTAINRLLMIMCCALLVWSLGLAITAAANNKEICMIGYLVAPFGWGPMSGLLLHFTLLLTEQEKLLKKWWIYPALYLPGLVMIYAFTILPAMGLYPDDFIHTLYGWVPVVNYDVWDYLFYAYYISFTITNLILLLSTRITSPDKSKRTQVTWLAICYIIAYTLGTLSDVVFGYLDITIPRLSTIFSLIPIGAIAYSVMKYGPLSRKPATQSAAFRTDHAHSNVYRVMSFGFAIGSILNIISQKLLYQETGLPDIDKFSVFLIFVAIIILLINELRINSLLKEMSMAIVYSIIIPYMTLRFVQYGSITIWAFVFLLFILCLIYNRRILLITITMSSLMTQVLVWAISPRVLVEVNVADYSVRLGLIGLSAILTVFVNSIYVAKLKENFTYDEKQTLLAEISRDFISAEEWNKDEILHNLLEKCSIFIKSERAYIIVFEQDKGKLHYSCEWLADGTRSFLKDFENLSSDIHRKLFEQFESEGVMKLPDANLLPPIAGKFKKLLAEQNIRGMVNLPVREKGKIIGIMGFNSSRPLREWNLDSSDFMEIVANVVSDMLLKIKVENRNKFLAYHDQLTRLPNRISFKEHLDEVIKQASITRKTLAVVFLDIDSFKAINDTMGHDLGDTVLYEVAQTISDSIRYCDAVSRFGGDEFVIILNEISGQDDVEKIMDGLMTAISKPLNIRGQEFYVTISVGCALYPEDGEDSETLIKNADTAMHHAKGLGKNQYLMCTQAIKDQVEEQLVLTNHLHRALEREQLVVYYQPLVDMTTKSIVGFEALLRWSLPERGIISPGLFIPIAEQTRLINPIGEWVLETACRQNKLWQEKGFSGLRMAVNVSVVQLGNPNFVQQVEAILKKTGLAPKDLELEITESAASNNVDNIVSILASLKALGLTLSIDDFGTEYSSLSRLKVLPIDRIKMDMQFVHGIEGSEKDQAIVKVIINLAKSMKVKVIAEGVETKIQLDFLSQLLCDEVQGYYYYRPMPAEEIEEILVSKSLVDSE
ncbi:diguanylate cyclase (GGDEF) domain-containing protein [Desulfitobacterium dichloroeliminans LMG P-21439]|uniref:Diguanylate cyclase (GGDEF) domain-containing protein n=1 Tax=Desulfitobacterium dichloroeliminans (strain LMG P-21439 / DCA1) TaxID=871963 RepID=L0F8P4_DESDL|nr:EAL domain-containing protein [Desulfitobacterium dichloroeliminans]AGA69001.1 diguanylate cyclase (GGDEF) domain-containing protein [Desulfitobacterium dichloroeliminans LMG P-21439]